MWIFEYPYVIIFILLVCLVVLGGIGAIFAIKGVKATEETEDVDFSDIKRLENAFCRLGKGLFPVILLVLDLSAFLEQRGG